MGNESRGSGGLGHSHGLMQRPNQVFSSGRDSFPEQVLFPALELASSTSAARAPAQPAASWIRRAIVQRAINALYPLYTAPRLVMGLWQAPAAVMFFQRLLTIAIKKLGGQGVKKGQACRDVLLAQVVGVPGNIEGSALLKNGFSEVESDNIARFINEQVVDAIRDGAAKMLGKTAKELSVEEVLNNLPETLHFPEMVDVHPVAGSDPRKELRGQKGLQFTQDLPRGQVLGIYSGHTNIQGGKHSSLLERPFCFYLQQLVLCFEALGEEEEVSLFEHQTLEGHASSSVVIPKTLAALHYLDPNKGKGVLRRLLACCTKFEQPDPPAPMPPAPMPPAPMQRLKHLKQNAKAAVKQDTARQVVKTDWQLPRPVNIPAKLNLNVGGVSMELTTKEAYEHSKNTGKKCNSDQMLRRVRVWLQVDKVDIFKQDLVFHLERGTMLRHSAGPGSLLHDFVNKEYPTVVFAVKADAGGKEWLMLSLTTQKDISAPAPSSCPQAVITPLVALGPAPALLRVSRALLKEELDCLRPPSVLQIPPDCLDDLEYQQLRVELEEAASTLYCEKYGADEPLEHAWDVTSRQWVCFSDVLQEGDPNPASQPEDNHTDHKLNVTAFPLFGNNMRFINDPMLQDPSVNGWLNAYEARSETANCMLISCYVAGFPFQVMCTKKAVEEGEEASYAYGMEYWKSPLLKACRDSLEKSIRLLNGYIKKWLERPQPGPAGGGSHLTLMREVPSMLLTTPDASAAVAAVAGPLHVLSGQISFSQSSQPHSDRLVGHRLDGKQVSPTLEQHASGRVIPSDAFAHAPATQPAHIERPSSPSHSRQYAASCMTNTASVVDTISTATEALGAATLPDTLAGSTPAMAPPPPSRSQHRQRKRMKPHKQPIPCSTQAATHNEPAGLAVGVSTAPEMFGPAASSDATARARPAMAQPRSSAVLEPDVGLPLRKERPSTSVLRLEPPQPGMHTASAAAADLRGAQQVAPLQPAPHSVLGKRGYKQEQTTLLQKVSNTTVPVSKSATPIMAAKEGDIKLGPVARRCKHQVSIDQLAGDKPLTVPQPRAIQQQPLPHDKSQLALDKSLTEPHQRDRQHPPTEQPTTGHLSDGHGMAPHHNPLQQAPASLRLVEQAGFCKSESRQASLVLGHRETLDKSHRQGVPTPRIRKSGFDVSEIPTQEQRDVWEQSLPHHLQQQPEKHRPPQSQPQDLQRRLHCQPRPQQQPVPVGRLVEQGEHQHLPMPGTHKRKDPAETAMQGPHKLASSEANHLSLAEDKQQWTVRQPQRQLQPASLFSSLPPHASHLDIPRPPIPTSTPVPQSQLPLQHSWPVNVLDRRSGTQRRSKPVHATPAGHGTIDFRPTAVIAAAVATRPGYGPTMQTDTGALTPAGWLPTQLPQGEAGPSGEVYTSTDPYRPSVLLPSTATAVCPAVSSPSPLATQQADGGQPYHSRFSSTVEARPSRTDLAGSTPCSREAAAQHLSWEQVAFAATWLEDEPVARLKRAVAMILASRTAQVTTAGGSKGVSPSLPYVLPRYTEHWSTLRKLLNQLLPDMCAVFKDVLFDSVFIHQPDSFFTAERGADKRTVVTLDLGLLFATYAATLSPAKTGRATGHTQASSAGATRGAAAPSLTTSGRAADHALASSVATTLAAATPPTTTGRSGVRVLGHGSVSRRQALDMAPPTNSNVVAELTSAKVAPVLSLGIGANTVAACPAIAATQPLPVSEPTSPVVAAEKGDLEFGRVARRSTQQPPVLDVLVLPAAGVELEAQPISTGKVLGAPLPARATALAAAVQVAGPAQASRAQVAATNREMHPTQPAEPRMKECSPGQAGASAPSISDESKALATDVLATNALADRKQNAAVAISKTVSVLKITTSPSGRAGMAKPVSQASAATQLKHQRAGRITKLLPKRAGHQNPTVDVAVAVPAVVAAGPDVEVAVPASSCFLGGVAAADGGRGVPSETGPVIDQQPSQGVALSEADKAELEHLYSRYRILHGIINIQHPTTSNIASQVTSAEHSQMQPLPSLVAPDSRQQPLSGQFGVDTAIAIDQLPASLPPNHRAVRRTQVSQRMSFELPLTPAAVPTTATAGNQSTYHPVSGFSAASGSTATACPLGTAADDQALGVAARDRHVEAMTTVEQGPTSTEGQQSLMTSHNQPHQQEPELALDSKPLQAKNNRAGTEEGQGLINNTRNQSQPQKRGLMPDRTPTQTAETQLGKGQSMSVLERNQLLQARDRLTPLQSASFKPPQPLELPEAQSLPALTFPVQHPASQAPGYTQPTKYSRRSLDAVRTSPSGTTVMPARQTTVLADHPARHAGVSQAEDGRSGSIPSSSAPNSSTELLPGTTTAECPAGSRLSPFATQQTDMTGPLHKRLETTSLACHSHSGVSGPKHLDSAQADMGTAAGPVATAPLSSASQPPAVPACMVTPVSSAHLVAPTRLSQADVPSPAAPAAGAPLVRAASPNLASSAATAPLVRKTLSNPALSPATAPPVRAAMLNSAVQSVAKLLVQTDGIGGDAIYCVEEADALDDHNSTQATSLTTAVSAVAPGGTAAVLPSPTIAVPAVATVGAAAPGASPTTAVPAVAPGGTAAPLPFPTIAVPAVATVGAAADPSPPTISALVSASVVKAAPQVNASAPETGTIVATEAQLGNRKPASAPLVTLHQSCKSFQQRHKAQLDDQRHMQRELRDNMMRMCRIQQLQYCMVMSGQCPINGPYYQENQVTGSITASVFAGSGEPRRSSPPSRRSTANGSGNQPTAADPQQVSAKPAYCTAKPAYRPRPWPSLPSATEPPASMSRALGLTLTSRGDAAVGVAQASRVTPQAAVPDTKTAKTSYEPQAGVPAERAITPKPRQPAAAAPAPQAVTSQLKYPPAVAPVDRVPMAASPMPTQPAAAAPGARTASFKPAPSAAAVPVTQPALPNHAAAAAINPANKAVTSKPASPAPGGLRIGALQKVKDNGHTSNKRRHHRCSSSSSSCSTSSYRSHTPRPSHSPINTRRRSPTHSCRRGRSRSRSRSPTYCDRRSRSRSRSRRAGNRGLQYQSNQERERESVDKHLTRDWGGNGCKGNERAVEVRGRGLSPDLNKQQDRPTGKETRGRQQQQKPRKRSHSRTSNPRARRRSRSRIPASAMDRLTSSHSPDRDPLPITRSTAVAAVAADLNRQGDRDRPTGRDTWDRQQAKARRTRSHGREVSTRARRRSRSRISASAMGSDLAKGAVALGEHEPAVVKPVQLDLMFAPAAAPAEVRTLAPSAQQPAMLPSSDILVLHSILDLSTTLEHQGLALSATAGPVELQGLAPSSTGECPGLQTCVLPVSKLCFHYTEACPPSSLRVQPGLELGLQQQHSIPPEQPKAGHESQHAEPPLHSDLFNEAAALGGHEPAVVKPVQLNPMFAPAIAPAKVRTSAPPPQLPAMPPSSDIPTLHSFPDLFTTLEHQGLDPSAKAARPVELQGLALSTTGECPGLQTCVLPVSKLCFHYTEACPPSSLREQSGLGLGLQQQHPIPPKQPEAGQESQHPPLPAEPPLDSGVQPPLPSDEQPVQTPELQPPLPTGPYPNPEQDTPPPPPDEFGQPRLEQGPQHQPHYPPSEQPSMDLDSSPHLPLPEQYELGAGLLQSVDHYTTATDYVPPAVLGLVGSNNSLCFPYPMQGLEHGQSHPGMRQLSLQLPIHSVLWAQLPAFGLDLYLQPSQNQLDRQPQDYSRQQQRHQLPSPLSTFGQAPLTQEPLVLSTAIQADYERQAASQQAPFPPAINKRPSRGSALAQPETVSSLKMHQQLPWLSEAGRQGPRQPLAGPQDQNDPHRLWVPRLDQSAQEDQQLQQQELRTFSQLALTATKDKTRPSKWSAPTSPSTMPELAEHWQAQEQLTRQAADEQHEQNATSKPGRVLPLSPRKRKAAPPCHVFAVDALDADNKRSGQSCREGSKPRSLLSSHSLQQTGDQLPHAGVFYDKTGLASCSMHPKQLRHPDAECFLQHPELQSEQNSRQQQGVDYGMQHEREHMLQQGQHDQEPMQFMQNYEGQFSSWGGDLDGQYNGLQDEFDGQYDGPQGDIDNQHGDPRGDCNEKHREPREDHTRQHGRPREDHNRLYSGLGGDLDGRYSGPREHFEGHCGPLGYHKRQHDGPQGCGEGQYIDSWEDFEGQHSGARGYFEGQHGGPQKDYDRQHGGPWGDHIRQHGGPQGDQDRQHGMPHCPNGSCCRPSNTARISRIQQPKGFHLREEYHIQGTEPVSPVVPEANPTHSLEACTVPQPLKDAVNRAFRRELEKGEREGSQGGFRPNLQQTAPTRGVLQGSSDRDTNARPEWPKGSPSSERNRPAHRADREHSAPRTDRGTEPSRDRERRGYNSPPQGQHRHRQEPEKRATTRWEPEERRPSERVHQEREPTRQEPPKRVRSPKRSHSPEPERGWQSGGTATGGMKPSAELLVALLRQQLLRQQLLRHQSRQSADQPTCPPDATITALNQTGTWGHCRHARGTATGTTRTPGLSTNTTSGTKRATAAEKKAAERELVAAAKARANAARADREADSSHSHLASSKPPRSRPFPPQVESRQLMSRPMPSIEQRQPHTHLTPPLLSHGQPRSYPWPQQGMQSPPRSKHPRRPALHADQDYTCLPLDHRLAPHKWRVQQPESGPVEVAVDRDGQWLGSRWAKHHGTKHSGQPRR